MSAPVSDLLASGAHLVGSVPLASSEAVFRAVADGLGDRLRRIPDGETGPRSDWIVWQLPVFTTQRQLEVVPPGPNSWRPLPRVRLADGARAESVPSARWAMPTPRYPPIASSRGSSVTGWSRSPAASRSACPPRSPPSAPSWCPSTRPLLEPVYEDQVLARARDHPRELPHDQLAVQWDTNFELGMLEGVFPVWFGDVKGGILERLLRISRHVPPDVQLGYHLCYGDVQHRHFKEPADAGRLVEVANALAASLGRPLNWIHLPVPRERERRGVLCAAAAIFACARRPSSTWAWCITPTASRARAGAWRWRAASSRASASPPSAAGAAGRPPPSPISCASTPR